MSAPLVSVVGPPAAGKTTVARSLARLLDARLIREDYKGNPFLPQAYVSGGEANLPCQLYFLMTRARQLALCDWPEEGLAVSDYDFCQDGIYARRRLEAEDFALYRRIAVRVEPHVRKADVMIHLDAGTPELLRRIHCRGRTFEKAMTEGFLEEIRRAYHKPELDQAARRLIRVDTEKTDLRDEEEVMRLAKKVRELLRSAS
jgi:deoxyadenosine/deoxycytidine kinase